MAQEITLDQVRHVAHLARLHLTDEAMVQFQSDLSQIIDYIAVLEELDTSDVQPLAHPLASTNVLRQDECKQPYDSQTALQNAPSTHESFFTVPKVIDHEAG